MVGRGLLVTREFFESCSFPLSCILIDETRNRNIILINIIEAREDIVPFFLSVFIVISESDFYRE